MGPRWYFEILWGVIKVLFLPNAYFRSTDLSFYISIFLPDYLSIQVLYSTRNIFIVNMAISGILLCTLTMPLTLLHILNINWELGNTRVSNAYLSLSLSIYIYIYIYLSESVRERVPYRSLKILLSFLFVRHSYFLFATWFTGIPSSYFVEDISSISISHHYPHSLTQTMTFRSCLFLLLFKISAQPLQVDRDDPVDLHLLLDLRRGPNCRRPLPLHHQALEDKHSHQTG